MLFMVWVAQVVRVRQMVVLALNAEDGEVVREVLVVWFLRLVWVDKLAWVHCGGGDKVGATGHSLVDDLCGVDSERSSSHGGGVLSTTGVWVFSPTSLRKSSILFWDVCCVWLVCFSFTFSKAYAHLSAIMW